ncbi:zinc-binding dehydrogenase [Fontimonas sp. SYSU GA230001]|uniref:alcohol dehydrogenase catalytic domain-containing protein n=1 Tax=Fontimonas sp. SYSU GA230001 TaxID=3142450 RepID=UPI0032B49CB1
MRKIVIHRLGGYERLQIENGPDPVPGPGEVRVAVSHIGVNYADCVVRMGLYASARALVGWPITPGFEVAGTVDAIGAGVTDLTVGAPSSASRCSTAIRPRWYCHARRCSRCLPDSIPRRLPGFRACSCMIPAMDAVLAGITAGDLRPAPVTVHPFAEASRALRDLESGRTQGKLVLRV